MPNPPSLPDDTTALLYSRARDRARRATLWAALTGRSHRLLALGQVWQESHGSAIEGSQREVVTRRVPIAQIVGSQGRCGDFDRDLNRCTIATAHAGCASPPRSDGGRLCRQWIWSRWGSSTLSRTGTTGSRWPGRWGRRRSRPE